MKALVASAFVFVFMAVAPIPSIGTTDAVAKVSHVKKHVKKAKKGKGKKVAYKHCGTYKYWQKGKCLDARAKKK